jgi:etoposide-induced 2.4 mRNA
MRYNPVLQSVTAQLLLIHHHMEMFGRGQNSPHITFQRSVVCPLFMLSKVVNAIQFQGTADLAFELSGRKLIHSLVTAK